VAFLEGRKGMPTSNAFTAYQRRDEQPGSSCTRDQRQRRRGLSTADEGAAEDRHQRRRLRHGKRERECPRPSAYFVRERKWTTMRETR
jgi:hypothetical protein